MLAECASCGAPAPKGRELVAFDLTQGGALCRDCRRGVPISPDALALLARILGGGLAGALAEPDTEVTSEVAMLATSAMEQHLERRLRAVHVLDRG